MTVLPRDAVAGARARASCYVGPACFGVSSPMEEFPMSRALRVHTMSALVCCAVAATACGSDMPTGPSPRSLAEHFDSVLTQHPGANGAWHDALTAAIAALSLGVAPTTVQISVNGTATTFQAVAWDEVAPGFGVDSTIHIAAWTGGSNPASVMRID